jgi:hypothetical protein
VGFNPIRYSYYPVTNISGPEWIIMKVDGRHIWVTLFLAVFIVSGYFFYTVRTNQAQLQEQSVRSFSLAINNLKSSWENYKIQCQSDSTLANSISEDADLKDVLNHLLGQMPPGGFFVHTIITDSLGRALISETGIPLGKMPVDGSPDDPDEIRLGIVQSDMTISTKKYHVFQAPITLEWAPDQCIYNEDALSHESRQIILYATLSKDQLNQVRWQIPFLAVYILLSLFILIVVSYPIIRIVGMGIGDTLTGAQVYQTGLSIILLSLFIGFSISYFASRSEIKMNQKHSVEALTNKVEQFHSSQIKTYAALLDTFMIHGPGSVNSEDAEYKELVNIDRDGRILDLWLYSETNSVSESIRDALPNLAERHYFQRADSNMFYHGSHFSYSDGNFEGVISKKLPEQNDQVNDEIYVQAITYSFNNFDRADSTHLNNLGLKYLIINKSGEVYYQSPSVKTAVSAVRDVVNPYQWNELRALMENNRETSEPLELRISFEGQSYQAGLHRMYVDSPGMIEESWILVFDDPNLIAFRSYSVFMYSGIGYFFILIIFLVIGFIFYLFRPDRHYLSIRRFNDYLFRPSFQKRKEYLVLSLIILTHILFFVVVFLMDVHHFWLFILFFTLTITYIAFVRHILLSGILQSHHSFSDWKLPLTIAAVALFIIFLLLLIVFFGRGYIWTTVSLIIIQGTWLYILFRSAGDFSSLSLKKFEGRTATRLRTFIQKPKEMYSFVFAFWVLLIGMISGYAIHHSAFHFEDKLWKLASEAGTEEVHSHRYQNSALNTDYLYENSWPDTHMYHNQDRKHQFLNRLEYWRRQWLVNYTGVDYPVMNRYIYAGRAQILNAFEHEHHDHNEAVGHDHRDKGALSRALIFFAFLVGFVLLYHLIKNLSKRIFLTEYRDFLSEDKPYPNIENQTYLLTLDHQRTLKILEEGFLKNRSYLLLDLSSPSERKKMTLPGDPYSVDALLNDKEGIVLLNADRALISPDTINDMTNLITACKRKEKFVLMTGSKSMKELSEYISEQKDPVLEQAMSNWIDTTVSFFTMLIPIGYGLNVSSTSDKTGGSKYIDKLKTEIKYGPHTAKLAVLLKQTISKTDILRLTKKEYEAFILHIQRHNKPYYQNLWNHLTFREKQMVYNFANEGFVNYANINVLTELLQKGIFRMDKQSEEMRLFNLSFCNFATQAVTPQLAKAFKKDRKTNGNVSHLRNALLTIIFLAILAISLFAPELPERYIGAVSGGLALISSLASVAGKFSLNIPFLEK